MEKVLFLLLTYYGAYTARAVDAAHALMASSGLPYELVIVANGKPLDREFAGATVVEGDNEWHEFSGWQRVLDRLGKQGRLDGYAGVVLANDTFCHHNRFGWLTRHAFARAFRAIAGTARPLAAGEKFTLDGTFAVGGARGSAWLASYLVMLNKAALACLDRLVPEGLNADANMQEQFEQFEANPFMRLRLDRYLGIVPTAPGKPRWYGADRFAAEERQAKMAIKAAMILLEFRLSGRLTSQGAELVDVFASPWVRQLRRLEARPPLPNPH